MVEYNKLNTGYFYNFYVIKSKNLQRDCYTRHDANTNLSKLTHRHCSHKLRNYIHKRVPN